MRAPRPKGGGQDDPREISGLGLDVERIITFFAGRTLLVNMIAVAIVILGFWVAKDVPREYIPSASSHVVFVTAQLPGASARDVETKITIPIEEAIEEVDGVDSYTSSIGNGNSFTRVEFFLDSSDRELDDSERRLRDAINGITDFPPELEHAPKVERFNPAKQPIVQVALAGPVDSLAVATRSVERAIRSVDEIAQVEVVGLNDPEVRVLVDPQKAKEQKVTILDVVNAVARRNVSSTGGVLESETNRNRVVLWSRFHSPEDVADTIVRSVPGEGVVRIRHIARIEAGREDTGLIAHTGGVPGVTIYAIKRNGADAIDAVDGVRRVVGEVKLPDDVSVQLVDDRAFFTKNRLRLILVNGAFGALLVAGVLFFFMRGTATLWVCVGIPLVFFGALALIPAYGVTFNLFSLTGFIIVIGMVVDDAVVVAENIDTKRSLGLPPLAASVQGATEMTGPVAAAAITTVLAFTPLMSLGGMMGHIAWQMPAVVVTVLLFSLVESFVILPGHMRHGSSRDTVHASRPPEKRAFMLALEKTYRRALRFTIRHRGVAIAAYFLMLIGVLMFIRPLLEVELIPQKDATVMWAKVSTPIGTPIEHTEAVAYELQRQLQEVTEADLDSITARVGHQSTTDATKTRGDAENEALLTMVFKPLDRKHSNAEWIQILQERIKAPVGTQVVFQSQYLGPPTDQPITVHFFSDDDEVRRVQAVRLYEHVRNIPGLTAVEIDERPGTPQIDLNLDYEKLALAGLDARDVANTLQAAFHGIEATEHRDIEDTTEIRVMFDPAARSNLEALLEAPVRSRSGRLVPLRDLVNPVEQRSVDRIYHREGVRATTVRGSFLPGSDHSAVAFADYLENEIFPEFEKVPGLSVEIGGEAEQTRETTASIGQAAGLAVVSIGLVIWLLLGSGLQALTVLVVIPFSVGAVILALWVHGLNLSMVTLMGTVGLAGVVVNASIVMMDSVNRHLKDATSGANRREIAIEAMVQRLRPILVTTLTTLGGVLPTAYGIGGYDAIVSPISVAIGWGLVLTTMVTLFLVPSLYTLVADFQGRFEEDVVEDR